MGLSEDEDLWTVRHGKTCKTFSKPLTPHAALIAKSCRYLLNLVDNSSKRIIDSNVFLDIPVIM